MANVVQIEKFHRLVSCIWTKFQNPLYLVRFFSFILEPNSASYVHTTECIFRILSHFLFFSSVFCLQHVFAFFSYIHIRFMCFVMYPISRACWFFPKVIQSNFWIYSRISLRCCQIYVLRERKTSSCHRKSAFMKNKNCETEIKLNSNQQFTSFNACSFFISSPLFRLKES